MVSKYIVLHTEQLVVVILYSATLCQFQMDGKVWVNIYKDSQDTG